jgi:cytochrome c-type biogenesis protein CcmH
MSLVFARSWKFTAAALAVALNNAVGTCWAEALQPKILEKRTLELFTSIKSPFCPVRLLADCPSSGATELKEKIRLRLAAGVAPETVISELYDEYGDILRAAPSGEGFGVVAWLAPLGFLVLGLFFLVVWVKGRGAAAVPAVNAGLDPNMEARIDQELRKL